MVESPNLFLPKPQPCAFNTSKAQGLFIPISPILSLPHKLNNIPHIPIFQRNLEVLKL